METYESIASLINAVQDHDRDADADTAFYRKILYENKELIEFLAYLEITNPCGQEYYLYRRALIVSYIMRWEFIKFGKRHSVKGKYRVIGMPVSLSNPGYLYAKEDNETQEAIPLIVKEAADSLKGVTIILNADHAISCERFAPSTYVFYSRFSNFREYLDSLRSSYRRKIVQVLDKGKELTFNRLAEGTFTRDHYELYLRVCERSPQVFRVLSYEYFKDFKGEVFELRNNQGKLLAFIQLKELDGTLYFVYVGFRKEDKKNNGGNSDPDSVSLYFNLLLFIIRYGIEHGYKKIVLGQTSGESKSKVGCREEHKYIYVTASNPLINGFFRAFPRLYSFRTEQKKYKVFREELPEL